ncbi:MAG: HlyD family efflux transporter periplasmic adaptor subunit [Clostridiales bacterium]|nr:HlyD family efflux transporter periplasmic adaptor subunit [Clostridiales bacterium]
MKNMRKWMTLLLAALLLTALALPAVAEEEEPAIVAEEEAALDEDTENFEFDGTVVSGASVAVRSAVGGDVEAVAVRAGELVEAGDVLATLRTTKVYAAQDGTISAVFGAAGDAVDAVANSFGAVLYIEPSTGRYTIEADIENAYSNSDNLYIHVGEAVSLKCYSDGDHTGVGFVSAVNGSSYTVKVAEGEFEVGETVTVYRGDTYASKARLGRGTCARTNDLAVGAAGGDSGSIALMHVETGDAVKKGDLLYETVGGTYDAYYCTGSDIVATASGILGSLNCEVGGSVQAGGNVATIYPAGDMQLKISVGETDLPYIREGARATIRFNWDDSETVYPGIVFKVSHMTDSASQGEDASTSYESSYTAYVEFEPGADVRLGMTGTAVLTVVK